MNLSLWSILAFRGMFFSPLCPPSYLGLHLEGACLSLGSSRSRTWDRKVGACGLFGRQSQEEGQAGCEESQLWAPGSILWGKKVVGCGWFHSEARRLGAHLSIPASWPGAVSLPSASGYSASIPGRFFFFSFWQHIWTTFIKRKKNFLI